MPPIPPINPINPHSSKASKTRFVWDFRNIKTWFEDKLLISIVYLSGVSAKKLHTAYFLLRPDDYPLARGVR